jgi:hypothetical protein
MNRFLFKLIVFVAMGCFVSAASSKELIRDFQGSTDKVTADFEVKGPWIVEWFSSGDYPGQMALSVNLVKAGTGEYLGKIATTKYVDNGVRLFTEGGVYRFQVNCSLASWRLRVAELTPQEAKAYTPKDHIE